MIQDYTNASGMGDLQLGGCVPESANGDRVVGEGKA